MALFARNPALRSPAPARSADYSFPNAQGGLIGSIKDACQGACAGFLALIGATHLTSDTSAFGTIGSDIDFLDRLWTTISANGFAGPVEMLAGIVMFFAARRTISRTIGLLVFIGFIAAYANGYSPAEILAVASDWLGRLALVLEPIPVSDAG